jgi:cytochrome c biogenesis protein ResB
MEYDSAGKAKYSELLAVQDHGCPIVIAAGALLVIGVCLTVYFPHQQVWVWLSADGVIELAGRTTGDRVGFERRFDSIVESALEAAGEPPKGWG